LGTESLETRILEVLGRHLPRASAETVVRIARTRVRLALRGPDDKRDEKLLREVVRAVESFVPRARLTLLANELERAATAPSASVKSHAEPLSALVVIERLFSVEREPDVARVRLEARTLCTQLGASAYGVQKGATVTSELARNIVSYTPGGTIKLVATHDRERTLLVRATDRGHGIANLPDILAGLFRSKTGMGMGLRGVRSLSKRFDARTAEGGTTIEALIEL
jgi:serine/threonine-protein kinase RsbT